MEKEILEFELIFLYDIYIKKKLYNNILSCNIFDHDLLIQYQNLLYNFIDDVDLKIKKMFLVNYPNNKKINDILTEFFLNIKTKLNSISITNNNLRKFYIDNFANLDEDIVDLSHDTFVGYTFFDDNDTLSVIKKCHTVNELLHVAHSLTINNYDLINKYPYSYRKLKNNYLIKFHGIENSFSKKIFEILDDNLDTGDIDIFSLSKTNKVLMMIRDKGHATTLEIENDKDKLFINYFIPKIINALMINKLPGVKKITNNDSYTVGMFYLNKNEILKLNKFIEMIPDDFCSTLKGGIAYDDSISLKSFR